MLVENSVNYVKRVANVASSVGGRLALIAGLGIGGMILVEQDKNAMDSEIQQRLMVRENLHMIPQGYSGEEVTQSRSIVSTMETGAMRSIVRQEVATAQGTKVTIQFPEEVMQQKLAFKIVNNTDMRIKALNEIQDDVRGERTSLGFTRGFQVDAAGAVSAAMAVAAAITGLNRYRRWVYEQG